MASYVVNLAANQLVEVRDVQRGEALPTEEERLTILTTSLLSSPLSYLSRWGRFLSQEDLDAFLCDAQDNERLNNKEAIFALIAALRKNLTTSPQSKAKIRQNRFTCMIIT